MTDAEKSKSDPSYVSDFKTVERAEHCLIEKHRKRRQPYLPGYVGLALSGGGIRSASFGLGVLQALEKHHVIDLVDYMSTVSGGGYIGSSLTWFRRQRRDQGDEDAETSQTGSKAPEDRKDKRVWFPLGAKGLGVRSVGLGEEEEPGPGEQEELSPEEREERRRRETFSNAVLSFIRQHGNYLTPGRHGAFSLLALVVRNTLVSLTVYTALLTVLFACLHALLQWGVKVLPGTWENWLVFDVGDEKVNGVMLGAALGLFAVFVIFSFLYVVFSFFISLGEANLRRLTWVREWGYKIRLGLMRGSGYAWFAILWLVVIGSVPFSAAVLDRWLDEAGEGAVGLLSAGIGSATAVWSFMQQLGTPNKGAEPSVVRRTLASVRLPLAAFLVIYGLMLVAHALATIEQPVLLFVIGAVILGSATSLNFFGVNRMYRDRLMELFLPDDEVVLSNEWWRPAREAEEFCLSEALGEDSSGPYHILNTTLITVDDDNSRYRGRGGDSFILSPLYSGSDATGWRRTGPFKKSERDSERKGLKDGDTSWMKGGLTLASAMAISGAAVNPNTGVSGRGPTRKRLVSALMALLNLRLGYWAHNPKRAPRRFEWPANLLWPGLLQGVFARGLNSESRYVELSDGGHFENLGLYELVRREAKFIVVSDASGDPEFSFAALANAAERIRVDFGVTIEFRRDAKLEGLLPKSAGDGVAVETYELSERGYAIATIKYQKRDGQFDLGTLVYIKPTLTDDLSVDIFGYKDAHKGFPHESTADQFFDEEQFEAYRELGYRLTDTACKKEKVFDLPVGISSSTDTSSTPA